MTGIFTSNFCTQRSVSLIKTTSNSTQDELFENAFNHLAIKSPTFLLLQPIFPNRISTCYLSATEAAKQPCWSTSCLRCQRKLHIWRITLQDIWYGKMCNKKSYPKASSSSQKIAVLLFCSDRHLYRLPTVSEGCHFASWKGVTFAELKMVLMLSLNGKDEECRATSLQIVDILTIQTDDIISNFLLQNPDWQFMA